MLSVAHIYDELYGISYINMDSDKSDASNTLNSPTKLFQFLLDITCVGTDKWTYLINEHDWNL